MFSLKAPEFHLELGSRPDALEPRDPDSSRRIPCTAALYSDSASTSGSVPNPTYIRERYTEHALTAIARTYHVFALLSRPESALGYRLPRLPAPRLPAPHRHPLNQIVNAPPLSDLAPHFDGAARGLSTIHHKPCQAGSPSPCPPGSVVTNARTAERMSAGMPYRYRETRDAPRMTGKNAERRRDGSPSLHDRPISITTLPPSGIASLALTTRFSSSLERLPPRGPAEAAGSPAHTYRNLARPCSRRSIGSMPVTIACHVRRLSRHVRRGRLNASSRSASPAPRSAARSMASASARSSDRRTRASWTAGRPSREWPSARC